MGPHVGSIPSHSTTRGGANQGPNSLAFVERLILTSPDAEGGGGGEEGQGNHFLPSRVSEYMQRQNEEEAVSRGRGERGHLIPPPSPHTSPATPLHTLKRSSNSYNEPPHARTCTHTHPHPRGHLPPPHFCTEFLLAVDVKGKGRRGRCCWPGKNLLKHFLKGFVNFSILVFELNW